eukprot:GHVU01224094.1.p3 GENE.GHVU01224094.1~~GHVU01224094.1.p3  ORF type:complete len:135 (-),score=5.63 GHVU01224094.1:400-804(-)
MYEHCHHSPLMQSLQPLRRQHTPVLGVVHQQHQEESPSLQQSHTQCQYQPLGRSRSRFPGRCNVDTGREAGYSWCRRTRKHSRVYRLQYKDNSVSYPTLLFGFSLAVSITAAPEAAAARCAPARVNGAESIGAI